MNTIPEIKPGQIYRHYKGNLYKVLCIAKHTETLEPLVVYCDIHDSNKIWVRPLNMWNDIVECDGYKTIRFLQYK